MCCHAGLPTGLRDICHRHKNAHQVCVCVVIQPDHDIFLCRHICTAYRLNYVGSVSNMAVQSNVDWIISLIHFSVS